MSPNNLTPFPCTSCGKCCRSIGKNSLLSLFDRGDGICKFLDETSNLCSIYKDRPIVCQIEAYYKRYLTKKMSWEQFVNLNIEACIKLQKTGD